VKADTGQAIGSVGAGSDWRFAQHLTGGVTGGWAVQSADFTRAGAFNLLANIRFTY
jgi:hypothetical protein